MLYKNFYENNAKKLRWMTKRISKALRGNCYKWRGRLIHHRGSDPDLGVIDQILVKNDYDLSRLKRWEQILGFYDKCDRPLIIDAGANIGVSAIWFSEIFPRASIIAIEPQRENYSLLAMNTRGIDVKSVRGALSSHGLAIKLFDPGHGEWGFRTAHGNGPCTEEVESFSVDQLIPQDTIPFILKIDIEGAEDDVFSKNLLAMQRFPLIIIELHDWMLPGSASSRSFLRWHSSQNRDFVYINENVFSISNDI